MKYPDTHEEVVALKKAAKADARRTANIAEMHRAHGVKDGYICGDCKHFGSILYARRYFKCGLFKLSRSMASDWRKKWAACGKWEGTK
jgi:hypothetical protein